MRGVRGAGQGVAEGEPRGGREGKGHLRALRVGETWREMSKPTGGAEIGLRMALKVWHSAIITVQVAQRWSIA
jgi:hypothetical protein